MTDQECLRIMGFFALVSFSVPSILFLCFKYASVSGISKSDLEFKSDLRVLRKSIHNPSVSLNELGLSVELCKRHSGNPRIKAVYRLEYASLLSQAETLIQSKFIKAPQPTLRGTADHRTERNHNSEDIIEAEFIEGRECILMKAFP